MSASEHDIAVKMGLGFAKVVEAFLGPAKEGLERHADGKPVRFGADIELRIKRGVIVGRFIPRAPVIKPVALAHDAFVLQADRAGQLEFVYAGSLDELQAAQRSAEEARAIDESEMEEPTDNVGEDEVVGAPVID